MEDGNPLLACARLDGAEHGGLAQAGQSGDEHRPAVAELQGAQTAAERLDLDLPPPQPGGRPGFTDGGWLHLVAPVGSTATMPPTAPRSYPPVASRRGTKTGR
jgi:hypothetical protein